MPLYLSLHDLHGLSNLNRTKRHSEGPHRFENIHPTSLTPPMGSDPRKLIIQALAGDEAAVALKQQWRHLSIPDPEKRKFESGAFARAMEAKHTTTRRSKKT